MDSLDLSTHQFILSELASSLAGQAARGKLDGGDLSAFAAPAPKTHFLSLADVRSQVGLAEFCSVLATSPEGDSLEQLAPVVSDLRTQLSHLVDTEFEESMGWYGWSPPDQLAYALVTGLLLVSKKSPSERTSNVKAVIDFAEHLAVKLSSQTGDTHAVATRFAPGFHGLYRAIADISFPWSTEEFVAISKVFHLIGSSSLVVRRLNDALVILPEQEAAYDQAARSTRRRAKQDADDAGSATTLLTESDEESLAQDETAFEDKADESSFEYRSSLLAFYERSHRPLSGQFVLCASVEILTSILSQVLAVQATATAGGVEPNIPVAKERLARIEQESGALSTQRAWRKLLTFPVAPTNGLLARELSVTLRQAVKAHRDAYRFVINEQAKEHGEIAVELYSLEILSETLKLAVLADIAQARTDPNAIRPDVNGDVFVRVRTLLSEQAMIYEPILQSAALQCTGVLVLNFANLVMPMTSTLRRFVTTPLAMFESLPGQEDTTSPILISAAKALRSCVTAHGDKDLVVSTVYTLLNYLGRDTGFVSSGSTMRSGHSRATSREPVMAGRTEEQKAAITNNTIAVVSRLALEVGTIEVVSLTLSMLLQRLRASDGFTEGIIMLNIVPLAIAGTNHSFVEVVRTFTSILRSTMAGGVQRRDSASAHVALFKLARSLKQRGTNAASKEPASPLPGESDDASDKADGQEVSLKQLYLVELLQLFNERGKQLQTATSQHATRDELGELRLEMARLLPTIAELLSHDDLNPHLEPTLDMVALFRNMWFLAVLFNLANPHVARRASLSATLAFTPLVLTVQSVVRPSTDMHRILALVALKTPTLVPESARNYLDSDLEYNSVLKREFGHTALEEQRKLAAQLVPAQSNTTKVLKLPEIVFLLTIYNVEIIRSCLGRPSMLLWYFVNEGLNSSRLVDAMDGIADKVIHEFVSDIRPRMANHNIDSRITEEIQNLFLGSVHRVAKVRQVSRRCLDHLFLTYPTLMCSSKLVVLVLEILTLLRQACEAQFTDEYMPVYHFVSDRAGIAFDLGDDYVQREEILRSFLKHARKYLQMALTLAPIELKSLLEEYVSNIHGSQPASYTELGKSVAAELARSAGVGNRQEAFLPPLGGWTADATSRLFDDVTAKSNYGGEMTGIHLALSRQLAELKEDPTIEFSEATMANVKAQLVSAAKSSNAASKEDIRRLLYRTAALIVALPHVRAPYLCNAWDVKTADLPIPFQDRL